jgi:hypothetical protein
VAQRELAPPEATWSCTIDLSVEEQITLDFELMAGGSGVRAVGLVAPRSPASFAPAECGTDSFAIIEGGVTYSPTRCVPGLAEPGACVIRMRYSDWLTGTFDCRDLPGDTGPDVLSTLNGESLGMGSFDLRGCEIIGE